MTEDPTKDLTTDEMLRALMADMRDVKGRLGALEAQGEDRTKTTRPLLDQLIKEMVETRETLTARADETNARLDVLTDRVAAVEQELVSINSQFETFAIDHMKMRSDIRGFNARLAEVEQRPN